MNYPRLIIGVVILSAAFAWAYWPTLVLLVDTWNRVPDYSHGFFVAPLALFFLWVRRDRFPEVVDGLAWPGLVLIVASIAMRALGARVYMESVDGWSILLWVAGVVWLLWGRRVLWWSLPSIAFLWFMVPLPWRLEQGLSLPLQRIATKLSCFILQLFAQPALAEGNTILLGEHHLEVEQACSGLRIFVGIIALAFAYVILVQRSWWEKVVLLASVLPIALLANSTRIVGTALVSQYLSEEAGRRFTHDIAGWIMIPFAAGLFALVLWYLALLIRETEIAGVASVVRRERI